MSASPAVLSRTSARCSPPPASPAASSTGCSPAARLAPGSDRLFRNAAGSARMNRTGLFIALGIGAVVGIVFGFWPRLDLAISGLFFDPATKDFRVNALLWVQ